MKVLLAPAEYTFKSSNYHVTYNIIRRLSNFVSYFVLTNKIIDPKIKKLKVNIFELNTSLMYYPFKTFLVGRKLYDNVFFLF